MAALTDSAPLDQYETGSGSEGSASEAGDGPHPNHALSDRSAEEVSASSESDASDAELEAVSEGEDDEDAPDAVVGGAAMNLLDDPPPPPPQPPPQQGPASLPEILGSLRHCSLSIPDRDNRPVLVVRRTEWR